nr:MAG TPA: hypothetical protein [Caudoviricetes sp.]
MIGWSPCKDVIIPVRNFAKSKRVKKVTNNIAIKLYLTQESLAKLESINQLAHGTVFNEYSRMRINVCMYNQMDVIYAAVMQYYPELLEKD